MATTNVLPAASGKGRLIILWTLSGLVALAFIGAGGGKLAGTAVMVGLFDKVGLGQWFRYFTGLLEVAGGPRVGRFPPPLLPRPPPPPVSVVAGALPAYPLAPRL